MKLTSVCFVIAFSAFLILCSCSSGDNQAQPGTPAFSWNAAKETFAAGDYNKTVDHLEKLVVAENDYTARAQPWLLVVTSGMARGYADLADAFEAGSRASKRDPASFRRSMNNYRGAANRTGLRFAEVFDQFQKSKGDQTPLAFSYPTGNASPPAQLAKISSGIPVTGPEMDATEKQALQREVLLSACRAAGAEGDSAKAQELFRAGNVQEPRAVFVMALAKSLYEQSQLYNHNKMDDPEKQKIFSGRALAALKSIPETQASKELSGKITGGGKRARI
jgi:hypothetical protein